MNEIIRESKIVYSGLKKNIYNYFVSNGLIWNVQLVNGLLRLSCITVHRGKYIRDVSAKCCMSLLESNHSNEIIYNFRKGLSIMLTVINENYTEDEAFNEIKYLNINKLFEKYVRSDNKNYK